MKAVIRWLVGNLPIAILAIVLAVMAWAVATEEADPVQTRRYPQPIPVALIGLSDQMVLAEEVNERAYITIRAPESVWSTMRADNIAVNADLAELKPGIHDVPLQAEIAKQVQNAEIVQVDPQNITVALQQWEERTVPVRVQQEGEPAMAYAAQQMVITPTNVTVSGPSSYVNQVVEAGAQVSVQNANADVETTELTLTPLNAEGQRVSHVTLTPDTVDVQISVELKEDYRTLSVKPVREGLVAQGYTITGFSVNPEEVTVSGAPEVIAALPGFIETETISVESAQADVVIQPTLNVPSGVVLVPNQQVTVTYYVKAIPSSRTMEITPTIQGLAPGLTATVSPNTIEVFLNGPLPQLEALKENDIRIVLDLFGLEPDTHQIEPQVVMPSAVTDYSILPAVIQVEITIAPTPEPTVLPEPTPATETTED